MVLAGTFAANGLLGGVLSDSDSPFGSNEIGFASNGLLGGSTTEDKASASRNVDEGSNSDAMLLDEGFASNGLLGGVGSLGVRSPLHVLNGAEQYV